MCVKFPPKHFEFRPFPTPPPPPPHTLQSTNIYTYGQGRTQDFKVEGTEV